MTWRSTTWARWLGWTLVFTLVVGGSAFGYLFLFLPLKLDLAGLELLELIVVLLPSVIAAGLIGLRFPSGWWVLGPPAVFFALLVAWSVEVKSRGSPRDCSSTRWASACWVP